MRRMIGIFVIVINDKIIFFNNKKASIHVCQETLLSDIHDARLFNGFQNYSEQYLRMHFAYYE